MSNEPNIYSAFDSTFLSSGGGTPVSECGCGRICYATESPYYEEGELELLQQKQSLDSKKFIPMANDAVSFFNILGRDYVWGCPCNYAEEIQDMLWKHRKKIISYLTERINIQSAQAAEDSAMVQQYNNLAEKDI